MYRTLSSRTVLSHPRLTVAVDEVEMPNGARGDYLWFPAPAAGAVTILARDTKGRVLVEREYSYLPGTSLYQFVGGGIEADETPEEAAVRELAEETGQRASRFTLLGTYLIDHRRSHKRMYIFLAEDLSPLPAGETHPHDLYEVDLHCEWLTEPEIAQKIASGEVVNSTMLAVWALYQAQAQRPGDNSV